MESNRSDLHNSGKVITSLLFVDDKIIRIYFLIRGALHVKDWAFNMLFLFLTFAIINRIDQPSLEILADNLG